LNFNIKDRIQKIPKSVKSAILIVIAAKILVFALGYIVSFLNSGPSPPLTIVMTMFNHWDAPHYEDIAKNWYVSNPSLDAYNFIVFFPLYPILIRFFTFNFDYINLSALIVANLCSLIAFFYLYKLAKLEFGESSAVKAVLSLSIFPLAYFLSVPYTEGLFFALVIASIYYARLGKWHLAGILSMFAALTRVAGVLLLPVLIVEYFHQRGWKPTKIDLKFLWIFSGLAGFLIYLGINLQVTGSPFTFLKIEAVHWFNRLDPVAGLQLAYSWATTRPYPDNLTIGIAPIIFAIFGLAVFAVSIWKRMRPVYIVYMFFAWALAVSTSWWISVPRYIMAMFPMFMLMGTVNNRKAVTAVTIASGAIMCFFTVFWARGWWAF
jgi:hypothetical protein